MDASYLFELHPQPLWIVDPRSLRFLAVNEAAILAYGYTRAEFLALSLADIQLTDGEPGLADIPDEPDRRSLTTSITRHRTKDGSLLDVKVSSAAIEVGGHAARLILVEDITVVRRLEAHLRQTQRLEVIGGMAGSVVHDVNNVLLAIRGHSSALLVQLDEGAVRQSVQLIDRAAARAAEFTHQLLAFSRPHVQRQELVELNVVVDELIEMLARLLGERIEVDAQLAADVAPILVDRGQLTQAILNLVVNARDAMPDGGRLTIRTANVEGGAAAGRRVALQVTDTGVGMDAATRGRLYEPFFTTKPGGTGLGLTTVFKLVAESNGAISVSSEPGGGTTFELLFPGAHLAAEPPAAALESDSLEGDETILLVDDEAAAMRSLTGDILESYGYTVLFAAGGGEALLHAQRNAGSIDVLITDVVMPDMNGLVLAERIRTLAPSVRVLFTSASPSHAAIVQCVVSIPNDFLEKPYLPHELARRVRGLLARR